MLAMWLVFIGAGVVIAGVMRCLASAATRTPRERRWRLEAAKEAENEERREAAWTARYEEAVRKARDG